mmetsp:Transcript_27466/g.37901  ORF Transcript_27466/g.37901 Transcript_27466/m.37901 type:complete len:200 (+) Transcript_27466:857-1456(+)
MFIKLKVGGVRRGAVLGKHCCSGRTVMALGLLLPVHERILCHRVRPLSLGKRVHLVPLALSCIEVESGRGIPRCCQLVRLACGGKVRGVLSLYVIPQLRLRRPKRPSLVPHVGLCVDVHSFFVCVDADIHLCSLSKPTNLNKTMRHRGDHISGAAATVVHGHVHRVLPCLFQQILICAYLLRHLLEADVDRRGVFPLLL